MKKNMFWFISVVMMILVTGGSQVWAEAPVANFTATPTTGPGPLTVTFTDTSTGAPESWAWDFNNDAVIDSTAQNPTYTFSVYGSHTVSLTVTNVDGSDDEVKTDYISVATGVDFYARRGTSGSGPFRVDFRDSVSSDVDPATYVWNFGDSHCDPADNTSNETDPQHYYNYAGTYTVSLMASGTDGTFTEEKVDYITVSTGANMSFSPHSGKPPLTVNFSATGSGDVTGWSWDFNGDGIVDSTDQNPPPVVYSELGGHRVILTATGDTTVTGTGVVVVSDPWTKTVTQLASADPDECFNGLGERVDPISTDPFTCPDPDPETQLPIPMTNQTYVWSLTEVDNASNHSLWFGTGANVLCTTQGALISEVNPGGYGSSVCEYGDSPMVDLYPQLFGNPASAALADWRRAKIYRYDLDSGELVDRTPANTQANWRFNICLGLRSAGSHRGVVFLAGGSFTAFDAGIVMFAYNAATGAYIGSANFPAYRTIRKWKVIQDELYVGVGTPPTDFPALGEGRMLKWTGQLSTDPAQVFQFEEVGVMPNIGAGGAAYGGVVRELAEYIDGDGQHSRIAAMAKGVWLSPQIPEGGLTNADYDNWELIWSPEQYEPDEVTLNTYVGGGIEFLNGWLYFMTMHIPGNAADAHRICDIAPLDYDVFGPDICFGAGRDPEVLTNTEYNAVYNNTFRSTTLWRIRNAEDQPRNPEDTQLLFGEAELPHFVPGVYDPEDPNSDPNDAFEIVSTGYTPKLGSSGFNTLCNNYGWVMEKAGDSLFAGTMDFCSLYQSNAPIDPNNPFGIENPGFDLWRITGGAGNDLPTVAPETTSAFKGFNNVGSGIADVYNYVPYGDRTLIRSSDSTKLFVGVATGNNLDAVGEGNGWTLLMLDSTAPQSCSSDIEPAVGDHDYDIDGLDLYAAEGQLASSPEDLQAFAQQFGSVNCTSEAVAGVASVQEVTNIDAQSSTLKVKGSKNNKNNKNK